jgi:hypothetical protein
MKVKTSTLKDRALDWAVARCEGWKPTEVNGVLMLKHCHPDSAHTPHCYVEDFGYSTDWAQGGPIIERIKGFLFKQGLESNREGQCQAEIHNYDGDWIAFGPTPLIAAMRCHVASHYGEEVEVPDELCQQDG